MRNTMNSAFTHQHAAKRAGRLARRAVLACALVLGAGGAFAQQHGDRRDDRGDMQQSQSQSQMSRFRLPPQDRDQRDDMRAYEEQRRAQQQEQREQQHDSRRPSRMTPDERRDLRRQINEAGMDLYPQRR
jgi:hypothetical protein